MPRINRSNAKRLGGAIAVLIVLGVVFSAGHKTFETEVLLPRTDSKAAWDFVADFSNMRLLNPTILSFTITDDGGNTHHWRYSVQYVERLSHWPYWLNTNTARVAVKHNWQDAQPSQYVIESQHQTCFLSGWYCLNSLGTFTFVARGPDTLCRETVEYECPPFMGSVCRAEVAYQREAIAQNLAKHFAN